VGISSHKSDASALEAQRVVWRIFPEAFSRLHPKRCLLLDHCCTREVPDVDGMVTKAEYLRERVLGI
jgi:hypothetical protein